ncbi:MAG: hypothetical protein IJ635_10795 [Bacteroidaceae bacterium]|nr:hypothetical protein [Bacteroidaceae bacterium]
MTLNVHRRHSPVSCENDAQCLLPTMPNVLSAPLPVISNDTIQCLAHSVANVFLALLPVITLLRGSSSPCPHARHHSALMLVSSVEVFSEE